MPDQLQHNKQKLNDNNDEIIIIKQRGSVISLSAQVVFIPLNLYIAVVP